MTSTSRDLPLLTGQRVKITNLDEERYNEGLPKKSRTVKNGEFATIVRASKLTAAAQVREVHARGGVQEVAKPTRFLKDAPRQLIYVRLEEDPTPEDAPLFDTDVTLV